MKKHKIGVVGYFANGVSKAGGQEAKTCFLTQALENFFVGEKILCVDTLNWRKNPLKLLFNSLRLGFNCENVVILPAQNGVRVFIPLFLVLKFCFRFRLDYVVVGGWLPDMIQKHSFLSFCARRLNGIYVESVMMKNSMENQGFKNVHVLPNFKFLTPITELEVCKEHSEPYKLCTFSRVMQEKGIEDAINAVKSVNEKYNMSVFELHIYGKLDEGYIERFEQLKKEFPPYIKYCGEVKPSESVSVLKHYFALLFPTYYQGEGFAGTIIDAFSSGVPVIATDWRYNGEIIKNNSTGYVYDYKNKENLNMILEEMYLNPENIEKMRCRCIEEVKKYSPENVIKVLAENMDV